MKKLLCDEGGQALVEYALILMIVVTVISGVAIGFRKSLFSLWRSMAREISAACPGCPADPTIN